MFKKIIFIFALVLFSIPLQNFFNAVFAEEYKYDYRIKYDDNGKVSDVKTEGFASGNVEVSAAAEPEAAAPSKGKDKVKIYSTPSCPYCVQAKSYLDQRGVDYEDIDVSKDKEAAQEMKKISGQTGVPVIVIGDQVIVGFSRDRIEKALFALE